MALPEVPLMVGGTDELSGVLQLPRFVLGSVDRPVPYWVRPIILYLLRSDMAHSRQHASKNYAGLTSRLRKQLDFLGGHHPKEEIREGKNPHGQFRVRSHKNRSGWVNHRKSSESVENKGFRLKDTFGVHA